MRLELTKRNKDEEKLILRQQISTTLPKIEPVIKTSQILNAREVVKEVYIDEKIENYITDIVFSTRFPEDNKLASLKPYINYGASPRATINLALASKAYAFIKRRGYVIPEDVRAICLDVMRHRIGLTYEAEADNISTEEIINKIINKIDVP